MGDTYRMNLLTGLLVLSPFTAVLVGLYALYLTLKGKLTLTLNYWSIGLLALFFWSLIVSVFNKSLLSALGSLLLLVYFFASQFAEKISKNKDILHKVINLIVFFTSIAAVIGLLEKIVFALMGYAEHRIFSLFGNPNMTGCWFVIVLFMTAYLSLQESENKNIKWYVISAILMVIALLLTGSRGSFAALTGTVILIAVLRGIKFNKKTLFIIFTILSLIALIVFAESNIISDYIVAHPFEDSLSPRLKIWKDAFLMIKERPLTGWGVLTTLELGKVILPHYNMPTIHVHNLWLTLLTTMGLVGLSIYLYIKFRLFKDIILLFNNNNPGDKSSN